MGRIFTIDCRRVGILEPALGEQLNINGAALISVEAELVGVAQPVEVEMLGAARVGAVQKRAVSACLVHTELLSAETKAGHDSRALL